MYSLVQNEISGSSHLKTSENQILLQFLHYYLQEYFHLEGFSVPDLLSTL